MGPDEALQAALVARRFFLERRTKTEIAGELGLSRFKIARLLDACLAEGIVRIEINLPGQLDADLSDQFRRAFGLRRAMVLVTPPDPAGLRDHLGRAAAELLGDIVTEDDVLGIGWGRTLSAMARQLRTLATCPVVQLTGVTGSVAENSMELVRRVTAVSGGSAYPIYAPLVVSDGGTAAAIRRQPGIRAAMAQFDHITIAAVTVGSWEPPDSQLRDSLSVRDRNDLAARGVRAEVCTTLLREDGRPVVDLDTRSIAITLDQLRAIPELILVAGGETKTSAIAAVLAAGMVSSVITDAGVASRLLSTVDTE